MGYSSMSGKSDPEERMSMLSTSGTSGGGSRESKRTPLPNWPGEDVLGRKSVEDQSNEASDSMRSGEPTISPEDFNHKLDELERALTKIEALYRTYRIGRNSRFRPDNFRSTFKSCFNTCTHPKIKEVDFKNLQHLFAYKKKTPKDADTQMINRDWLNLIGTEFSTMTFGDQKITFECLTKAIARTLYWGSKFPLESQE